MNRKIASLASCLMMLLAGCTSQIDPSEPTPEPVPGGSSECTLLSLCVASADNYEIKSDINFAIDSAALSCKGSYLEWIEGDKPEMMVPRVSFKGVSLLVNGEKFSEGESISFAKDLSFTVVAENGNKKTYNVSLVCPQINGELPVLHFTIPVEKITSKEVYLDTKLEMYSPFTTEGWWALSDSVVQIRGRGNSTWDMPKKPYRIKFPEDISPIGLDHAKAKSWVILAHDMDKSLIRNHLAFEISRVLFNKDEGYHDSKALTFTPCSQFVAVYFDTSFHGVYQMSDQMERKKGRIAVDKLGASDGSDPDKIKGGYILETDIHKSDPSPIGFASSTGIWFSHKYPEDDDYDQAQFDYIEDFVSKAEAALYGSDFKDPEKGWRAYFDEKSLADYIIVKELAGDMDGFTSTYAYKMREVDKLFFGPVWDCDKGWRNDKRVPNPQYKPTTSLMIYAGFGMPYCTREDWYKRLWQDETFKAFVQKRWQQKKDELLAAINNGILTVPASMSKAIEANYMVWDFHTQSMADAPLPAKDYNGELKRLSTFTISRAAVLDRLFK